MSAYSSVGLRCQLTRDKVDGKSNVVLFSVHLEIRQHSFDLCITDIRFVDVCDEVENSQHRHESPLQKSI
jgi:hypothetical protein